MLSDELVDAMHQVQPPTAMTLDVDKILASATRQRRTRTAVMLSAVSAGVAAIVVFAVIVVQPADKPARPDRPARSERALTTPAGTFLHRGNVPEPAFRNPTTQTPTQAATAAAAAFAYWGPTRGDLAANSGFLAQVRNDWTHPTGSHFIQGSRQPVGPIRILFAGNTPDGPAAVVAQRTSDPLTRMNVGIMTTENDHLVLWGPNSPIDNGEGNSVNAGRFDDHQVSFASGPSGHLVVLPVNPTDTVAISPAHQTNKNLDATRTWTQTPTSAGTATVTLPQPANSWDTLIRTTHAGRIVGESPVWINSGPLPTPANLLGYWTQIAAVVGKSSVPERQDTYTPWVRHYGAGDEPYGTSSWSIEGTLPDGSGLIVKQLYLLGDPAHTVILRIDHHKARVLTDLITNAAARPLLAARLPQVSGWLIAAGPQSTITGYRTLGAPTWTVPPKATVDWSGPPGSTSRLARSAAFLPTTAHQLQLRLEIRGDTATVDETQ